MGRVRTALDAGAGLEIVVVDDGSRDATASAAGAAGADQVIRLPVNRGKGAAVRAGALASRGSAVVFTDADLSYPPAQIERLVAAVEEGWDVVVGNREDPASTTSGRAGTLRDAGHWAFNLATRAVLSRSYADTQCGLKAFHRLAADELFSRTRIDRFAFDVEILWLAERLGLQVREVPVELDNIAGSTVRMSLDTLRMVRDLGRMWWWARGSVPARHG